MVMPTETSKPRQTSLMTSSCVTVEERAVMLTSGAEDLSPTMGLEIPCGVLSVVPQLR